jgi:cytoskeletal protein CcmA (bactofilin family)/ribosomal protein S27E
MAELPQKIEVSCPECGQTQKESENFISTVCRGCGAYFKSSHAPINARKKVKRAGIKKRELTCADCGAVQMVADEAQSSSCLECGRHLELGHRVIDGEHLGNLVLEGELTIGPKGNFGGSKARAARIVLQGRANGFLQAAEWLRVEGQAHLRSGASGEILEVRPGASLESKDTLLFRSGQIDGELRCRTAQFSGPLKVGSTGKIIAEQIVFSELTVDEGGRIHSQGEVRMAAEPVVAQAILPANGEITST